MFQPNSTMQLYVFLSVAGREAGKKYKHSFIATIPKSASLRGARRCCPLVDGLFALTRALQPFQEFAVATFSHGTRRSKRQKRQRQQDKVFNLFIVDLVQGFLLFQMFCQSRILFQSGEEFTLILQKNYNKLSNSNIFQFAEFFMVHFNEKVLIFFSCK